MAVSVGVEISPSAVRALILDRSGSSGSSTGRGAPVKLLSAREIVCETSNPTALTRALTQLRQSLRITQPVVLGLPSTSAILATVQPLIVSAHRATLAVEFELQQLLPFALQEVEWHYHWLAATNGHPKEHSEPEQKFPISDFGLRKGSVSNPHSTLRSPRPQWWQP